MIGVYRAPHMCLSCKHGSRQTSYLSKRLMEIKCAQSQLQAPGIPILTRVLCDVPTPYLPIWPTSHMERNSASRPRAFTTCWDNVTASASRDWDPLGPARSSSCCRQKLLHSKRVVPKHLQGRPWQMRRPGWHCHSTMVFSSLNRRRP